MHRTASRPFDPSPTLCHLPSLTHGLFITTWPGFSRQLRDRILARKGRRGEGGKRARGRMVRVAECRVQLYQYPTRCRQGLRLAAWFTLRLCTVFVRMVCTKVILFSAVDEFTWRDGSMSYFANGTKGKLDLNELKGAWQRLAWRVFPRWCNSGMVLVGTGGWINESNHRGKWFFGNKLEHEARILSARNEDDDFYIERNSFS